MNPNRLRGRLFNLFSIFLNSSPVMFSNWRFLVTYCRSRPFKFSLEPRSQLAKDLAKLTRAAQRFINLGVPAEFFVVVIGQRLGPCFKRLELFDDRRANQVRRLVLNLGHDRITTFALHHHDDGLLVARTNDGFAFPMTHLQALVTSACLCAPCARSPICG